MGPKFFFPGAYRPKPPLHGLSLSKSPIKNHAILFGSGLVIKPDQTKLGSTKPNKEQVSRLHFYFHDTLSGKNPSAVEVAKASMTKKSPSLFGLLNIFDDPLTKGPEPTSMLVGRAQASRSIWVRWASRTKPTCGHELCFHNWEIQW